VKNDAERERRLGRGRRCSNDTGTAMLSVISEYDSHLHEKTSS